MYFKVYRSKLTDISKRTTFFSVGIGSIKVNTMNNIEYLSWAREKYHVNCKESL